MDSPVKPANDAKGSAAARTIPSLQRKLESRADHPLDSSFRWNDAKGGRRRRERGVQAAPFKVTSATRGRWSEALALAWVRQTWQSSMCQSAVA